jgi:polar amino acid transport system substrate-binding protein
MRRAAVTLLCLLAPFAAAQPTTTPELKVGISGSEPFVVRKGNAKPRGIAVEIWQSVAAQAGWRYKFMEFPSVPDAMHAIRDGKLDVAVGPITITAERVTYSRFTQPFFSSHLAILSRTESPSLWQRIAPFFSESFFFAVGGLLTILAVVGTLIWLSERGIPDSHFPRNPVHGIGCGIWFAVVTMSTVGYGDMAPKTLFGRAVTGAWIIISFIAATSLVAGIASTLTLTGLSTTVIATAEQLRGREVAVLAESPSENFASRYGAHNHGVPSLAAMIGLLEDRTADAVVFDRPQLQYFLRSHSPKGVALGDAFYEPQHYGFALPLRSELQHDLNVHLLQLREAGVIDRIARTWLGAGDE